MSAQLRKQNVQYLEVHGDASSTVREFGQKGPSLASDGGSSRQSPSVLGGEIGAQPIGNVQSFLDSVTPIVDLQTIEASDLNSDAPTDAAEVPFFWLRDFWSALERWSCFGAGVPLQLEGGEQVVQYYTPYLSGIQLFTRQDCDEDRPGQSGDASRGDSDWSDTDFRDSSSDSSDTSERFQARLFECAATMFSVNRSGKKGSVDGAPSIASTDSDDMGSPSELAMAALRDSSSSPGPSCPTCVDCKGGDLCFQYFEKNKPHMRLPLCDQILELAKSYPALTSLRSLDLHPSSWISIAWYPLYMIPSSLSLKDMGASFLTFHGLSTQLPSPSETCSRCREEFWAAPRISPKHTLDTWEDRVAAACRTLGVTLQSAAEQAVDGSRQPIRTLLPPFGMCGYKVKGSAWSDIRTFDHLRESAEAWVKQVGVTHPDHRFFSGLGFMS